MTDEPGRTRDAGWQIGVSRTVDHPVEEVWDLLTSERGRDAWLGSGVTELPDPGGAYATAEGTTGETRSLRPQDRIRLTWRPDGWTHETTVQVAVRPTAPGRTMIRFHQERLADASEREQQRAHWAAVLDDLEAALAEGPSD